MISSKTDMIMIDNKSQKSFAEDNKSQVSKNSRVELNPEIQNLDKEKELSRII